MTTPAPVSPPPASRSLANLFDSPTPPRPTGRGRRPGNSALFLDASPSSTTAGSPSAVRRGLTEATLPAEASGSGGASGSRGAGAGADALALFDGLDFDEPVGDEQGGEGDNAASAADTAAALGPVKRSVPKIDEKRLLGDQGISNLVKTAKKMKFKGKGRETEDLNNLMDHYHVWAHTLFPKSKFKDTISTVEKVCKKRNMQSSISRFKLEYDPPAPPSPSPPPEARSGNSPLPSVNFASSRPRASRSASPSARRTLFAQDHGGSGDESDGSGGGRRAPGRASGVARALRDANGDDDDEDAAGGFDMDDLIRAAEEDARVAAAEMARAGERSAPAPVARSGGGADEDEEMEMDWAELDRLQDEMMSGPGPRDGGGAGPGGSKTAASAPARARTPSPRRDADADEDDWAMFDEMNA